MGVIAVSAPRVNSPMPTISSAAPIKKAISVAVGRGATVKLKITTMAVMGTTEANASRIFSPRMVRLRPRRSRHAVFFFQGTPITSVDLSEFLLYWISWSRTTKKGRLSKFFTDFWRSFLFAGKVL